MTLDEQYQKTIDDQRAYLLKLQDDFNKACDGAKAKAQEKLKITPEDNKEKKEEILKEQKGELENALHILKTEIDRSTRETMKQLEKIITEKEKTVLENLEKQMSTL